MHPETNGFSVAHESLCFLNTCLHNMLHVFCLYLHAPINLSLPEFILVRLVTDSNRNRSSPFAYGDEVFSRGAFVAVATVLVGPGGEQHPHPWLFHNVQKELSRYPGEPSFGIL